MSEYTWKSKLPQVKHLNRTLICVIFQSSFNCSLPECLLFWHISNSGECFCIYIWLSFAIHYFIFRFKCCSILHFAVCQLLCWAFLLTDCNSFHTYQLYTNLLFILTTSATNNISPPLEFKMAFLEDDKHMVNCTRK